VLKEQLEKQDKCRSTRGTYTGWRITGNIMYFAHQQFFNKRGFKNCSVFQHIKCVVLKLIEINFCSDSFLCCNKQILTQA